jgi:hypothetical protein
MLQAYVLSREYHVFCRVGRRNSSGLGLCLPPRRRLIRPCRERDRKRALPGQRSAPPMPSCRSDSRSVDPSLVVTRAIMVLPCSSGIGRPNTSRFMLGPSRPRARSRSSSMTSSLTPRVAAGASHGEARTRCDDGSAIHRHGSLSRELLRSETYRTPPKLNEKRRREA